VLDIGLTARTYRVWKRVIADLGEDWERLATAVAEPAPEAAWPGEVAVERFHASILRRLAERALAAGEPEGRGDAWRRAGGTTGNWLELDDLLRTLRAHRAVSECTLLARPDPDPPTLENARDA
jgi:hypothetical protein